MGLKNKLGKIKSFFVDEIDEEPEVKVPIKKEKRKDFENTKKFQPKEIDNIDDLFFEDISEEEPNEIKSRSDKKEKEFPFVEFDEDDFAAIAPKEEPVIEPIKKEPKPVPLYQGSRRKEETKKFRPSPIISPIYGLLDEEGNMVKDEKESSNSYVEEYNFDEIRKKAYGKLDDELEDTMKTLKTKTIEEAENDARKELSREHDEVKIIEKSIEEKVEVEEDDDDMILPNVSFKEIDVDKEKEKKTKKKEIKEEQAENEDDDDDDTKEQDLFNLIDTMYNEEGDED